jgi:hypothetical protein
MAQLIHVVPRAATPAWNPRGALGLICSVRFQIRTAVAQKVFHFVPPVSHFGSARTATGQESAAIARRNEAPFGPSFAVSVLTEETMSGQRNDDRVPGPRLDCAGVEKRREVRYELSIEIEVSGIDRNGEVFHVRTFTRNVSKWGCRFLMSVEVKEDDIIALHVISSQAGESAQTQQSLFQVLHVKREQDGWLVGAWKMDNEDVWGIDLEKAAKTEKDIRESRKA